MASAVELVLSLLARSGHEDPQWLRIAFERAATLPRLQKQIALKSAADKLST